MEDQLIDKYYFLFSECENLLNISEVLIIPEDDINLYLELLKLENKEIIYNQKKFTIKVGLESIIILDKFKLEMKDCCKNFILKIRKRLNENDCHLGISNLTNILLLTNLILVFSPEFYTIYNMKLQIINILKKKDSNEIMKFLISEYKFVNYINSSNRKCSVSWHYRLFIIGQLQDKNYNYEILNNIAMSKDQITIIPNFYSKIQNIINVEKDSLNLLLMKDLALIDLINQKEKRNYHLWKYIIKLFDLFKSEEDRYLIFSFCLNQLINDPLDYSAYSNTVNLCRKLNMNDSQKEYISNYLSKLIEVYPEKKESSYFIYVLNEFK